MAIDTTEYREKSPTAQVWDLIASQILEKRKVFMWFQSRKKLIKKEDGR